MAKRLTVSEKEQISKSFINGESVISLSQKFNFSKLTIIRNLKNTLGDEKYQYFNKINNSKENKNNFISHDSRYDSNTTPKNNSSETINSSTNSIKEGLFTEVPFVEISPLGFEIDSLPQKELASVPLDKMEFPKVLYMIVDKNIELEIKFLKDYPEWDFLPKEDLNRKTIVLHHDLKAAKRLCKKDEKVIKVPNTNVFKIVAPILNSRGISRIIFNDQLIALWIYFLLNKLFIDKIFPSIDPLIKLAPIIKLTGNWIVSLTKKLTFDLLELFWIPIIKNKNNIVLKVIGKNMFFMILKIYLKAIFISINHKLPFF